MGRYIPGEIDSWGDRFMVLSHARLGPAFLEPLLKYAVYIANASPIRGLSLVIDGCSRPYAPLTLWYDGQARADSGATIAYPTLKDFRVFDCPAVIKARVRRASDHSFAGPSQVLHNRNIIQRNVSGIFVGLPADKPGWQIFVPASGRFHDSKDAAFDEYFTTPNLAINQSLFHDALPIRQLNQPLAPVDMISVASAGLPSVHAPERFTTSWAFLSGFSDADSSASIESEPVNLNGWSTADWPPFVPPTTENLFLLKKGLLWTISNCSMSLPSSKKGKMRLTRMKPMTIRIMAMMSLLLLMKRTILMQLNKMPLLLMRPLLQLLKLLLPMFSMPKQPMLLLRKKFEHPVLQRNEFLSSVTTLCVQRVQEGRLRMIQRMPMPSLLPVRDLQVGGGAGK